MSVGTNLLMITGLGSAKTLAQGKQGAFFNTLSEFHKYWDRIDIVVPKVKNSTQNLFGNVNLHVSPLPLIFHPFYFIYKVLKLHRTYRYTLMTVHDFPPFYNGIAAKMIYWKTKIPYILEIMHVPGYPKAAGVKEGLYRWLMRLFIAWDAGNAKGVRVINNTQVPEFLIAAGIPPQKITFIPAFYINLGIFKPLSMKKTYDLVFAARLEKNKGVINLLQGLKIIKLKLPDVKLLIIGNGPEKDNIESFIRKNNLASNVVFSGWLKDSNEMAQAYNSAKIFVNPSLNEGGPRVALEAMACGLPIVTTPVGIMVDIIENNQNGKITSWDPQEIATAISQVLEDQILQSKFSTEGLKTVKKFEYHQAIKNVAEKYREIMIR